MVNLESIKDQNVKIVSNPVQDQVIQVRSDNFNQGSYSFALFSDAGQLIFEQREKVSHKQQLISIPVKNLANGIYLLLIKGKHMDESLKVIIK